MPTITDWLMVIITGVYVVATVFIWKANSQSVQATNEQIIESKRQFEETRRLEAMPYLQFEDGKSDSSESLNLAIDNNDIRGGTHLCVVRVKNIGHGTAKDLTYSWENANGCFDRGAFPIRALMDRDEGVVRIDFSKPAVYQDPLKVSIILAFNDLLEYQYTQRIDFVFRKTPNTPALSYTTNPPVLKENKTSNT